MASNLLRCVYAKRALMNPKLLKLTATRALSSSVPSAKVNPHGWKNWRDIPDSALPKPADPTNPLYETDEYKAVQKKRIWYQIDDGVPIYYKDGVKDKVLVYTYFGLVFSLLIYEYYIIITEIAV